MSTDPSKKNEDCYLDRDIFNRNIHEIYEKSKLIKDNQWKLIRAEKLFENDNSEIFYLEKSEQKLITNKNEETNSSQDEQETFSCQVYNFIYHVIFSESFSVPVLYLNAFKSNGQCLTYDEIYAYFNLNKSAGNEMILSQQEHPILFRPYFFLHPCKTAHFMSRTKLDPSISQCTNYTLKWLSFVFSALNISLDLKYALNLNQNYPLYFKTPESDSQSLSEQNLKYWYTIHTALDVVEEKIKKSDSAKDLYLSLLYLIEDYRIYGYITNTKVKFLIIIETSNQQYHDTEIRIMFKKLHSCYLNVVCNPFYDIGTSIKSKKFEELVKSLMVKTNTVITATTSATTASNTLSTSQSSNVSNTSVSQSPNTQKQAEYTI